jgi:hypothetical protein
MLYYMTYPVICQGFLFARWRLPAVGLVAPVVGGVVVLATVAAGAVAALALVEVVATAAVVVGVVVQRNDVR